MVTSKRYSTIGTNFKIQPIHFAIAGIKEIIESSVFIG